VRSYIRDQLTTAKRLVPIRRPPVTARSETGQVMAHRRGAGLSVHGLVAGAVLELVAGAVAFLTDVPLVAVVLFLVGIVCLGASGDALRAS
jgi:hypothetical protein